MAVATRGGVGVPGDIDLEVLESVESRILWLATSIVHHANKVRETASGVKVGGHQASSASMVSIMTALYLEHMRGAGPGLGQAARRAGPARDQLPARPARSAST